MVAWIKVRVCDHSVAGIAISNFTGGVDASSTGQYIVQRSPIQLEQAKAYESC